MQQCACGKVCCDRGALNTHERSAMCPFRRPPARGADAEVHLFGPGVGYLCRTGGRFTEFDPVYSDYLARSEEDQRKVTHVWYPLTKPGVDAPEAEDDDDRYSIDWGFTVLELAATDKLATFDASALRPGDVLFGVYQERMAWSVYGLLIDDAGRPASIGRSFVPEFGESPSVPLFGAELLPRDETGLLRFGDVLLLALAEARDVVCPALEVADDHPLLRRLGLAPQEGHAWYLSPGGHLLNPSLFMDAAADRRATLLLLIAHGDSAFARVCDLSGATVPFDPETSEAGLDFVDSKYRYPYAA